MIPNHTEMFATGELDVIFDRNIVRWTKTSTFTGASIRRALISSEFVHAVAKFNDWNIKETTMAMKQNFAAEWVTILHPKLIVTCILLFS